MKQKNHEVREVAVPMVGEQANSETLEIGWISAVEAVELLSPHFGGDDRAQAQLINRLQNGRLDCRALSWGQEADVGAIKLDDLEWGCYRLSKRPPGQLDRTIFESPKNNEVTVSVPRDVFLQADNWKIDHDVVNWVEGFIVAHRPARLRIGSAKTNNARAEEVQKIRRFVFGLQFKREEIEAQVLGSLVVPADEAGKVEPPMNAERSLVERESPSDDIKPGRPPHELWSAWVAELILLEHEGAILATTTASGLEKLVADRMACLGLEPPSRSRTYPACKAVLNKLRDKGKLDS